MYGHWSSSGSAKSCRTMRTSWNEGKMLRPPERKTRGSALERDAAEDMVA
jgi:hypothetical protein